jgi:hypothetical protein
MLDLDQQPTNRIWKGFCEQHTEGAVELIDIAQGMNSRVDLCDACPVPKAGSTVIASAGCDG